MLRKRPFVYEAAADQGVDAIDPDKPATDDPFELAGAPIVIPDAESTGRAMLDAAGFTADEPAPDALETPRQRAANGRFAPPPAAAPAEEAPVEDAAAPALDAPPARYTQNEDGSVTLANGHTYASAEAAFEALWHAQDTIARGQHKMAEPEPPMPDPYEHDAEDEPEMLLHSGQPLGGAPETVDELYAWAEANPAAAGRWALQNQARIPAEVVQAVYNHWGTVNGADRDNYNIEMQRQQQQALLEQAKQEIRGEYAPVLQRQHMEELQHYDKQMRALPHFSHFEARIAAELKSDPDYFREFEQLPPESQFQVVKSIYAEMWVDDSIAAQAAQSAQAAPGGAAVAGAPAQVSAAPPVVEGRGGAAPPAPAADSPEQMVLRGVKAFQGSRDLFA
jgi:hypothetical protein